MLLHGVLLMYRAVLLLVPHQEQGLSCELPGPVQVIKKQSVKKQNRRTSLKVCFWELLPCAGHMPSSHLQLHPHVPACTPQETPPGFHVCPSQSMRSMFDFVSTHTLYMCCTAAVKVVLRGCVLTALHIAPVQCL